MERVSPGLWRWQPLTPRPDPETEQNPVTPGLDDADALRQRGWNLNSSGTRLCHVRVKQTLIFGEENLDLPLQLDACSLECLYTRQAPAQQSYQESSSMHSGPLRALAGDTVGGVGGDDEQNCNRVGVVPTLTVEGWEEGEGDTRATPVVGPLHPLGNMLRIVHGDRIGPEADEEWSIKVEFMAEVSLKEGEVLVGLEGGTWWPHFEWPFFGVPRRRVFHLDWVTFTVLNTYTGSCTTVPLNSATVLTILDTDTGSCTSVPYNNRTAKAKSVFCFKAPPGHYIAGFQGTEWSQEFPWSSLGLYFRRIPSGRALFLNSVRNPELFYPREFLRDVRKLQRIRRAARRTGQECLPLGADIDATIFARLLDLHLAEASPSIMVGCNWSYDDKPENELAGVEEREERGGGKSPGEGEEVVQEEVDARCLMNERFEKAKRRERQRRTTRTEAKARVQGSEKTGKQGTQKLRKNPRRESLVPLNKD